MRATNEVENNISSRAMSPSFVSKHFENGSVVYIRKPLEVPGGGMSELIRVTSVLKGTHLLPDGYNPG